MSTVADDVYRRIQALEGRAMRTGHEQIVLSSDEIAAFGAAYMAGIDLKDIRECGLVRIVNRDDPSTRVVEAKAPVKEARLKDDLARHQFACAAARRNGVPEPAMPAELVRALKAEENKTSRLKVKRRRRKATI